jgi:IS30 family transposase
MNTTSSYQQLDYQQRQTIAIGLEKGLSIRAIARILNRAPSSISREIARNSGGAGYACSFAQQRHERRRQHARPAPKLACSSELFKQVSTLLHQRWSPQQIAGHLAKLHPDQAAMRVSHETIYTALYAQPVGELRRDLIACLRMARAKRWPRSRGQDRRGQMADLLSIHVRPPEVEDRLVPGHWEGDLMKGKNNGSAVGTLVERTTRRLILVKLPHPQPATAAHVLQAFGGKLNMLTQSMRKTLTYDRGKEMSSHAQLSLDTGMTVYFCDPHSPWQRGSNENTNGLVRQYLPKGTDLSGYSQEQLDAIADEINRRPRKTLDWCSPLEVYDQWLLKLETQSNAAQ